MLDGKLPIKCPVCSRNSLLDDWDKLTLSKCTSREMRRAFTHLHDEKVFTTKKQVFFLCPVCENWSRGSELAIDTEDTRLRRLGRRPRVVDIENNKHTGGKEHG